MAAQSKPRVFLDSSVLIAALLSSRGASYYLLSECRHLFSFCTNEYVLLEILAVLDRKFSRRPNLKTNLLFLIGFSEARILPNPPARSVRRLAKLIEKEDTPILASALKETDCLLTLDHDFLTDELKALGDRRKLVILTPKELCKVARSLG